MGCNCRCRCCCCCCCCCCCSRCCYRCAHPLTWPARREAEALMDRFDSNGDGRISYDEFSQFMLAQLPATGTSSVPAGSAQRMSWTASGGARGQQQRGAAQRRPVSRSMTSTWR
ncbi:MAG: EF-hand domain-containing protein [Allorhizobium sp.]